MPLDAALVLSPVRPSTASLRGWQDEALVAMRGWIAHPEHPRPFLIAAAPGAGKTRPALELAREALASGHVRSVVIACPTGPLTRQWAQAAARLGLSLQPDADDPRPPGDFQGIVVTYARIAQAGLRWAPRVDAATLVIADEAHHLGDDLAWGEGFRAAFGALRDRWLLLSGTPFRSDQTPIPGVRYEDGVAVPDISYNYAAAVRDGICRPVTFIPYDGTLQWQSGDDVIEASFDDELSTREAGRRYRTAISVELDDGLPRILRQAHERLERLRATSHRDAGGLVVAADGAHAGAIAKVLGEITGRKPVVVVHTDPCAGEKLAAFTAARTPWLVAVNMVSEGVDIPRLRVGVYATAAKTPLIFRQIVGRFVRTIAGRPAEPSWVYLPGDAKLRGHATDVETELRHVLYPPGEGDPEAFDAVREACAASESLPDDFVPLSADVAPQMALFGPAPGEPRRAFRPVATAAREPVADEPAELPAYQRRGLLRDKRARLVSELSRRDGRSHAEINRWVNREVGVVKVGDATIEQLDRACEKLLQALAGRRPRR